MPRSTVTFVCAQCGGETLRWAGQCPYCQAWNTLQEVQTRKPEPGRRSKSLSGNAASTPTPAASNSTATASGTSPTAS